MPFERRAIVTGLLVGGLSALVRVPLSAQSRNSEVAGLKSFIQSTIGQPPAVRKKAAQDALKRDSGARLVQVGAMGVLARESTTREALKQDLPKQSKRLIDGLLDDLAGEGWVHAMAGAWHFEVVRRSSLGAMVYGASRKEGEKQFRLARASAPGEAGVFLLEAISLIYDAEASSLERIRSLLSDAQEKSPAKGGTYAQLVRRHAATLAKAAQGGSLDDLMPVVRRIY